MSVCLGVERHALLGADWDPAVLTTVPRRGCCSMQVASLARRGQRPALPPADELPGPDRLGPEVLEAYLGLMRCAARHELLALSSKQGAWTLPRQLGAYGCGAGGGMHTALLRCCANASISPTSR